MKTHLIAPSLIQEFSMAGVMLPVSGIAILYTQDILTCSKITSEEMTVGLSEHMR